MFSLNSTSSSSISIELFCGNIAQHMGVAKTNKVPHIAVCKGRLILGNLVRTPRFSREFMSIGGSTEVGCLD